MFLKTVSSKGSVDTRPKESMLDLLDPSDVSIGQMRP